MWLTALPDVAGSNDIQSNNNDDDADRTTLHIYLSDVKDEGCPVAGLHIWNYNKSIEVCKCSSSQQLSLVLLCSQSNVFYLHRLGHSARREATKSKFGRSPSLASRRLLAQEGTWNSALRFRSRNSLCSRSRYAMVFYPTLTHSVKEKIVNHSAIHLQEVVIRISVLHLQLQLLS